MSNNSECFRAFAVATCTHSNNCSSSADQLFFESFDPCVLNKQLSFLQLLKHLICSFFTEYSDNRGTDSNYPNGFSISRHPIKF